jgi:hypothetical protein
LQGQAGGQAARLQLTGPANHCGKQAARAHHIGRGHAKVGKHLQQFLVQCAAAQVADFQTRFFKRTPGAFAREVRARGVGFIKSQHQQKTEGDGRDGEDQRLFAVDGVAFGCGADLAHVFGLPHKPRTRGLAEDAIETLLCVAADHVRPA